jgi:sortase A
MSTPLFRHKKQEVTMLNLIAAGLIAVAIWQLGGAALIHTKAWFAPMLIERAWQKSIAEQTTVKPWFWADTYPIAKLEVPSMDITQYVLAGTNGGSLPFAPGHMAGTALPGEPGSIVIAAHRDTHFKFLSDVRPGATIRLTGLDNKTTVFEITGQEIVDARLHGIVPLTIGSELILVTCQPTSDFMYRGPLRLVVTARPVVKKHQMIPGSFDRTGADQRLHRIQARM